MLKKIKKWLPSKRKIMQLYFAVLFNANLKGFVVGKIFQGDTKKFCAPGINCYSCPGAIAACPLGSLQGAFSSDSHSTLYYVGGILLLYSIMFGRMICGWLCPFGLVQELCYKIKTPKLKKSPVTRILSFLKYAILVFFVFIVPIMYSVYKVATPAFCKYICPAGVVEGAIPLLSGPMADSHFPSLGSLFTWKFLLTVSIIVGSIFIFRLFCRFICPLGALYGLFNKISVFGIKVDNSKCTHCGLCQAKCKVDIRSPGDQECISCGECVGVCPTKAIHWSGPKIMLAPNEGATEVTPKQAKLNDQRRLITRCITAVVMVGVLIGAIVYFWTTNKAELPPPSKTPDASQTTNPDDPESTAPDVGNQVGNLSHSYELKVIDETGETGEVIDPVKTGKVTIINFWATWCGPCVEELPHFNQLAVEYGDSVQFIAIHSANGASDAPAFIAEEFPDYTLDFAWEISEEMDGPYYQLVGGNGGYPYTLVLDENGIVTALFFNSVSYDNLKAAIEDALK